MFDQSNQGRCQHSAQSWLVCVEDVCVEEIIVNNTGIGPDYDSSTKEELREV